MNLAAKRAWTANDDRFDLIVVGTGAAGLAAALIAEAKGLSVLLLEKTPLIGGTTAYSGGVVWVPNSAQNVAHGVEDSVEQALDYLDDTVPIAHEREARVRYLGRCAEAVAYLEQITGPLFYVRPRNSPDYFPEAKGASMQGRAMTPLGVDGRTLGDAFNDVRPPLPEFCLFGRQMLDVMDVYHLLNARRSLPSAVHAAKLMLRDTRDRVFYRRYGRGTRLTGGNALVAKLYQAVRRSKIALRTQSSLIELLIEQGRVTGVVVAHDGQLRQVAALRGVVLATGGFPWSETIRQEAMPHVEFGQSATSPDSSGDGIAIAMTHGAKRDTGNVEAAFWSPVSRTTRKDGSIARFPHLMADRAKPGLIAVNKSGVRFVNEAENYHDFVRAMQGRFRNEDQGPVHLVCDAAFVRKYPFGAVPPLASELRRAIASGYVIEGRTIVDLADKIGVAADALQDTVDRYNLDARRGDDTAFGKGSTAYNRYLGDGAHQPNPCLAPIDHAPYYAMRVHSGDIGTTSGLAADLDSRVLDRSDTPIDGLYACGNDRNSIFAGYYPSGGITIGPAITFAYLAVLHAAGTTGDAVSAQSKKDGMGDKRVRV